MASTDTVLDVFLDVARNPESIDLNVLECANDAWTYGDLDIISTGLAIDLKTRFGLRPIVAFVAENHPYVFAAVIATWKLGGSVAHFDHHSPKILMEAMLENIAPTFVVVPSTDKSIQEILKVKGVPCVTFAPKEYTITSLLQRFIEVSAELPTDLYPPPSQNDVAVFIHTSSASTVTNLKCVAIEHKIALIISKAKLTEIRKTFPQKQFEHLRVLGWSPWTHIIGFYQDIIAMTFFTKGCYIFGIIPSTYCTISSQESEKDVNSTTKRELDVPGLLLKIAIDKKPTIFCGVPWVLEGFRARWLAESEEGREEIKIAMQRLKMFGAGGAATSEECIKWAKTIGLPLTLEIGMTEIGSLFSAIPDGKPGWPISGCIIRDAQLYLVDENGSTDVSVGELYIRSGLINKGYHKHDSSAFSVDAEGKITFRTGDIYERTEDNWLVWIGRKDDFIQMSTGEELDPRLVEKALNECPYIAHSCVVGDKFLKGPSQVVCLIVEPDVKECAGSGSQSYISAITKAVAAVNRTLAPPLRIAWSRVLILAEGQQIPYTRKRAIFRKKIEDLFGEQIKALLEGQGMNLGHSELPSDQADSKGRTREEVERMVTKIVSDVLGIAPETLEANSQLTFAELGMDSTMAVQIVNDLNRSFNLRLSLDSCHSYVDLVSLTDALCVMFGLKTAGESSLRGFVPRNPAWPNQEEVVIVGQAVRLPGNVNTPESFWKALIDKRDDIITPVPSSRWDHESFYRSPNSTSPSRHGDITFEKAGFVDVAHFDNGFFGISSSEAFFVSPTNRLSLEVAFEALENANIPLSRIKGTDMGVFVATGIDDGYSHLLFSEKGYEAYTRFYGTGVANSACSGRLSYLLDVHGPSKTVDTACSASLVALDEAFNYIQSGRGESAIVCGINTHTWPGSLAFCSAQGMTSVNSRCATFTAVADGYVPSEGAAAIVLKSRTAAVRDGDAILSVIRATNVMHDGRSQGLVAPNVKAQIAMQLSVLQKAGLNASQIDIIETHGTGTSLGDLIEIQGINEVFRSTHSNERPLILGAAKTCFGHTELAAGLIGVLKAIASLNHGLVPGLVHLNNENLNPNIDCSIVPLQIPCDTASFDSPDKVKAPPRALVLANGFVGTIAAAIVERPMTTSHVPKGSSHAVSSMLFVVSAKTTEALKDYLWSYLHFCYRSPVSDFQSICFTSCVGREHYKHRFACVAISMEDLINQLRTRLANWSETKPHTTRQHILFAFPGQGSQYQGMASEISRYSGFKSILMNAATKAASLSGYPIASFLLESASNTDLTIHQSQIAQICIFIYQYAMCKWLDDLGIHPSSVMGHSLGEIAAAVVAEGLPFDVALEFVVIRAASLKGNPDSPNGMASIASSAIVIHKYINMLRLQDSIVIAVHNAMESHVVSGPMEALKSLVATVQEDGLKATFLNVDQGFHSPCIENALPALRAWLQTHEDQISPLQLPFFSAANGKQLPMNIVLGAHYWVEHARNPVKFAEIANVVANQGMVDIILDIGPQPTIWSSLQTTEFSQKLTLTLTGKQGNNQEYALLSVLAKLFENGITVNLSGLLSQRSKDFAKTIIPTYPFQRQHHYPKFIPSRHCVSGSQQPLSSKPEVRQFPVDQPFYDMLDDHRIEGRRVVPGAALVDFFACMDATRSLRSIRFHQPLVLDSAETQVYSERDAESCFVLRRGSDVSAICSGAFGQNIVNSNLLPVIEGKPDITLSHGQAYEPFRNVQFGATFRNIREINIWPDRAESLIRVEATANPAYDRIRKLDACLHMLGSIAPRQPDGAFLPTSLENFCLYTEIIPNSFICRYYLPLQMERNNSVMTASFDVLSNDGELLISCKKYSVAWIPTGVVIQEPPPVISSRWMNISWNERSLQVIGDRHKFEKLLYFSVDAYSQLLPLLAVTAAETFVFTSQSQLGPILGGSQFLYDDRGQNLLPMDVPYEIWINRLKGNDISAIIDLTTSNLSPGVDGFSAGCRFVLSIFKFLLNSKVHFSNITVISSMAAPVSLDNHPTNDGEKNPNSISALGAAVQGMLRVYRRETGLGNAVWGLDLIEMQNARESDLAGIIYQEIEAHYRGISKDTTIAYRMTTSPTSYTRLLPLLQRIDGDHGMMMLSGTMVIVGMGSIGIAVGSSFLSSGGSNVVFLGRRAADDTEIIERIGNAREGTKGTCVYIQADVCSISALRAALTDVLARFGAIDHILHTAAVVRDATIANVSEDAFTEVLHPKAIGAWNLHILSQELLLHLKSFMMFSSISVPLGNPGQLAYVAGNAYMDSLAVYRRSLGLPATSVQLGAWESKLIKDLDLSNSLVVPIGDKEGIPLIFKAMSLSIPVQVIASLDHHRLSTIPDFAQDPFFASILPALTKLTTSDRKIDRPYVMNIVAMMLRLILELKETDKLDLDESLTSYGIDSISFAQLRGKILSELSVEVPVVYMSDSFSIVDLINYIVDN